MGTTNAMKSKSVLQNISLFYYTVENLLPHYNVAFPNVHLLAICNSQDLKVYGFEPVLALFMEEMKQLEDTGFTVCINGNEEINMYATLSLVTCDNLALNQIFGFIVFFSRFLLCFLLRN